MGNKNSKVNIDEMLYKDRENSHHHYRLPYMPNYQVDDNQQTNITVWWFEPNFCQSRFGSNAKKGTNSCTLIVILTASKIAFDKADTVAVMNRLPSSVVELFGRAILEANSIYAGLSATGQIKHANFNIPEAMDVLQHNLISQLQEWFFVHVHIPINNSYRTTASSKLFSAIRDGLQMWHLLDFRKDYIFVILIADSRSVLLCFQKRNKIATMFDSHCHSTADHGRGAVIVQTEWKYLQNLTFWIAEMFINVYNSKPKVYELSFLPLKPS